VDPGNRAEFRSLSKRLASGCFPVPLQQLIDVVGHELQAGLDSVESPASLSRLSACCSKIAKAPALVVHIKKLGTN